MRNCRQCASNLQLFTMVSLDTLMVYWNITHGRLLSKRLQEAIRYLLHTHYVASLGPELDFHDLFDSMLV